MPAIPLDRLDAVIFDFDVRYRGHWGIGLHLARSRLRVRVPASGAAPVRVAVNGQLAELDPGDTREFPL